MHTVIKSITIAALLAVIMPAQAAIQNFQFSGQVESGYYNGTNYQGLFSFDDAGLMGSGTELLSLSSLNFNFGGSLFNLGTPALSAATAVFQNGAFTGIEWSVDASSPNIGFSFIAGSNTAADAYFAYDTPLGFSGTGNLTYVAGVPEPTQTGLLLTGLLVGWIAKRRQF